MDGYVRLNTDENGEISDIWDTWYKTPKLEFYIDEIGLDCLFEGYKLKPNSLLLIIFSYNSEVTETYMNGKEYDEWLEVENEIVLIENYNWEDIDDRDEEVESTLMEFRPFD